MKTTKKGIATKREIVTIYINGIPRPVYKDTLKMVNGILRPVYK